MNSVYYCFLYDTEFNIPEEWNVHLNASFFLLD